MRMEKPIVEFLEISVGDIFTVSMAYSLCQRKGIASMDQEGFCQQMSLGGLFPADLPEEYIPDA